MSPNVPKIYQRRHPQSTVLYQVVQNYFEDWLANYFLKHNEVLPRFVEMDSLLSRWRSKFGKSGLRIFIDDIQKQLKSLSPKNIINAKIGAISFI